MPPDLRKPRRFWRGLSRSSNLKSTYAKRRKFGAAWTTDQPSSLILLAHHSGGSAALDTNLASLAISTMHVPVLHELTSKSKFAKRAISFANLPSLQTGPAVATFLTVTISRAPTSVGCCRAQKKYALARREMSCRARSQETGRRESGFRLSNVLS